MPGEDREDYYFSGAIFTPKGRTVGTTTFSKVRMLCRAKDFRRAKRAEKNSPGVFTIFR